MRQDAQDGFGGPQAHQEMIDLLCKQLYNGVEKELVPLVKLDGPRRYSGRAGGIEYEYSTAGGALARYRPAGT
eukprot:5228031-Pyramimonas_sp.AAC.1